MDEQRGLHCVSIDECEYVTLISSSSKNWHDPVQVKPLALIGVRSVCVVQVYQVWAVRT